MSHYEPRYKNELDKKEARALDSSIYLIKYLLHGYLFRQVKLNFVLQCNQFLIADLFSGFKSKHY